MRKAFVVTLLSLLITTISFSQQTILHCGKLVDVKNKKVLDNVSIIIAGNKITDVRQGYTQGGANDAVIDLKKQDGYARLNGYACTYGKRNQAGGSS